MPETNRRINWERDELILACDLVAQNNWRQLRATDLRVAELSALLQLPWLHPVTGRPSNFRSVDSVQRKTADLATHHPDYLGARTKGGSLDEVVLHDFINDPETMHAVAARISALIELGAVAIPDSTEPDDDVKGREGRLLRAMSWRRERDPKLRQRKLDSVVRKGLPVACEVCAFDFGVQLSTTAENWAVIDG